MGLRVGSRILHIDPKSSKVPSPKNLASLTPQKPTKSMKDGIPAEIKENNSQIDPTKAAGIVVPGVHISHSTERTKTAGKTPINA
jgi:hypothetical protein